jgi:hypothetical protein
MYFLKTFYLETISDWLPMDVLLGAVTAKVGDHHFIHAVLLFFCKPHGVVLVEVLKDGPHLE